MPTRRHHHALFLVVVGLLLSARPARVLAVGEQNGRIRGTITEKETGAPVPGAQVTARSPSLIGGPQVKVSREDGSYELVELPPGRYQLEIAFQGVKPILRRVIVRHGETVPLDIAWSAELAATEVTVVEEERRMTRPDSTQTGTVISADTESKLATSRSYTGIANQVAGVGGSGAIPTVKGASRISNHYLVDGMDITDSVTNNFASQVNFDSIASMEVLTGGMEAQYNAIGGVINLNTNAGSDDLHIDTSFYVNNSRFSVADQYGSQLYEAESPFSTVPAGPTQSYSANLSVNGPLLKHRLWYSISLEYDYIESSTPAGPPIGIQHPSRVQNNFFPRFKLTWAPSSRHRITLSANSDYAFVNNRDQSNGELGIAEYGQSQGGAFTVLQWDYFHSDKISANLQTGFNFNHVHQQPMGIFGSVDYGSPDARFSAANYAYDPNQARHNNVFDNTTWYQGIQDSFDKRYTVQFDPSVSLRGHLLGSHDAKIGIQSRFVYHTFSQHTPGGSIFTDNGGPLESGICDPTTGKGCTATSLRTDYPDFSDSAYGFGIGAFIQDRWRVIKRLTILPGIRVDYGLTRNSLGQTVSSMVGVGPRLGLALDLTGDQKTIFTAYYGRANDTLNLLPSIYADAAASSTTYRWDPTANAGAGGYVYRNSVGGTGGYQLDPHAATPHTDEVTLGAVRQFYHDSIATINYTYRKISNIWDAVEVNQVWDASGERVVGYVNGQSQQVFRYTTPDQNYRIYHGLDFIMESRPTPAWDLYAAYTLSWLYGPGSESVYTVNPTGIKNNWAFYDPRQTKFYDGFLPEDQRHQFKAHASYTWHGLVLGTTVFYASGFPLTKQYLNQTDQTFSNKRTPQGTDPGTVVNDVHTETSFRTPDQLSVNVRVAFDFHDLIRQHLMLIADIFNVFNLTPASSLEVRDVALFAAANRGRQAPLRFQLGLRYSY